jgi:hypothetical protein
MSVRRYCDNCDRDLSDDPNYVDVRLEVNLVVHIEMILDTAGTKPLRGNMLEFCVECAKLRMAEVWNKLAIEQKSK